MNKQIATISLLLVVVLTGCKKSAPLSEVDQVVRVWDTSNTFWRDVRLGDYEWTLHAEGPIFGLGKNEPKFIVAVRDQQAEAILSKYCKGGKKVDGDWKR